MIIETFNLTWILMMLFFVGTMIFLTIVFEKKDQKAKDKFIYIFGIANIILFILYKVWLYFDDYDFVIWKEFPLQLCNINMFLILIAVKTKSKFLTAFCSYVAPLGAFMAMTFSEPAFLGNSIFLFRNIGYYGTHGIILIMGVLLFTLGYQKIKFKDIIYLIPSVLVIAFGAFLINNLFGLVVNYKTNYFFTCAPDGVSILEAFWSWTKIEYLYLWPVIPIFTLYICALNCCRLLIELIRKKTKKA